MFQHILMPTDLSDPSFAALPAAIALARQFQGKITIVNVHEEFIGHEQRQFLRVSPERVQEWQTERARESRTVIQKHLDELGVGDVPVKVMIHDGHPKQEILKTAEEVGADMIVIASTAHTSLGAMVLGSITEHVVRLAKVPVLVVHA